MAFRRVYDFAFEDDDNDEEFVVRRPRWIREREHHFQNLDNADFEKRFRLSKGAALQILGSIEEQIEFANDKNNSVSPMNQLLCTLRYYATGCHQMTVADFTGILLLLISFTIYGNAVLVGDSGYSSNKYFMTPFENCLNPAEQLYNESQIRTRNPVERMLGVRKRRFPVLSLGLRIDLDKVFPVKVATA
ncbi:uncharacterized protein LOC123672783, partial [Harmonia axyridis]|uniref:uncharacterized protein LOC123672783 n=1 Tax=Harmonia axyridis TaxID=115357 RepID=UPI001E277B8C